MKNLHVYNFRANDSTAKATEFSHALGYTNTVIRNLREIFGNDIVWKLTTGYDPDRDTNPTTLKIIYTDSYGHKHKLTAIAGMFIGKTASGIGFAISEDHFNEVFHRDEPKFPKINPTTPPDLPWEPWK